MIQRFATKVHASASEAVLRRLINFNTLDQARFIAAAVSVGLDKAIWASVACLGTLICFVGTPQGAWSQSLALGDTLVGDSSNPGRIDRYDASGNLVKTYDGTDATVDGVAITPDGNIVAAVVNSTGTGTGFRIYSPDGTLLSSTFSTNFGTLRDISVFSDGILAIGDIQNLGPAGYLQREILYTQTGTLVSTIALPNGTANATGSTVAPDGTLWQCDYGGQQLFHYNEAGTLLGTIKVPATPYDIVVSPVDGTLWVAGDISGVVTHLSTTGSLLGSFAANNQGAPLGIGISSDGASLTVIDDLFSGGGGIEEFTTAGKLIDQTKIATGSPFSVAVVNTSVGPGGTITGSGANAPEPTDLYLLGTSLPLVSLAIRRRK